MRWVGHRTKATARLPAADKVQASAYAFGEFPSRGDEAGNQISVARKIVEVPGVKQNAGIAQSRDSEFLIRSQHGYAE